MKKHYLVWIIVFALSITTTAQNNNEKGIMYFSAEIENPNSDSLVIMDYDTDKIVKKFYLKDGVVEKSSFEIEKGFYNIFDGVEKARCYLKAGLELHVFINTTEFDETIKYTGLGADENNFIAKTILLDESFGDEFIYYSYADYEEEKFLQITDSVFDVKFNFLEEHKAKLENDFVDIEYANMLIDYLERIADYEYLHGYFTEDESFVVSESFPNPFEGFDFDNENYFYNSSYTSFVNTYIEKIIIPKCKNDNSLSMYREYLNEIDILFKSPSLKEKMAEFYMWMYLARVPNEDLEYCFSSLKKMVISEKNISYIDDLYLKHIALDKGSPSPTFELYDIDSNLVKLEDFKGKYVFIDIWATWCKPCMAEIPYLDSLQEHFAGQDIVFVSMCVNDTKANWERIMEKANLKGIQLFVPEPDNDFISSYVVNGIPRFILIDENGLIVDSNAKRPSDSKLKEQLEDLLKD